MRRPLPARLLLLSLITTGVLGCTSAAPTAPTAAPAPPTPTTAAPKPAVSPATSASPSPSLSPSPSPSAIGSPSPAAAAAPRPANATLAISSPTNGQTVPTGSVAVTVQYSGPQLVAAANATKLDDYHLHYFLDENATPYLGTLVPVPQSNPKIIHTANLQVTFDNVAAGSHTVTVALSGANHITVQPPLSAQVMFTAQ